MKMLRLLGWFVGVLIIGALGSGLWDVAFRGLYDQSSGFLLTLVTLGLDSARNSIYAKVAQGHHELPSLYGFQFVVTITLMGPILMAPIWLMGNAWIKTRILPETSIEKRDRQISRLSRVIYIISAFAFFIAVVLFAQLVTMGYTNAAITHFDHSLAICAPALTSEEERSIRSQFALLKTSADYEAVIRRLQDIAAQHEMTLRQFTVW
jgi:disulfide bond formation protein DsbB